MKTMRIPLVAMAFALCTSGAFAQTAREIRGPAGVVPLASEEPPTKITAQGFLRRDDRMQGPAVRYLPEIGVFDLHRHGPAKGPRLLAPRPDLVCHRLHASLDVGWICLKLSYAFGPK